MGLPSKVFAERLYRADKCFVAVIILVEVELAVVPHVYCDYLVVVCAVESYLIAAVLFVVG